MSLKLYYDLMSQPSRALYIFFKVCNIPFEAKQTKIQNLEHLSTQYQKIHPFKKVPAIEHNDFKLIESVAILRYVAREFKVADHWYPTESKSQAKVDEYLEWQHMNTRLHCAAYFIVKFLNPLMRGTPPKPEKVAEFKKRMSDCLDLIETVWLKDKPFLIGNKISVADILGACEIEQLRLTGYDPKKDRPNLAAWMNRVITETSPYYQEAHAVISKVAEKQEAKGAQMQSML
ncbi:hypothetical protein KM043_015188 [Ampulex compressa]|nr:hypothetical protein KM043_015188 [Ampulex compressa]